MAAVERGHRAEVTLFPEGEPGQRLGGKAFAKVRLVPDAGSLRSGRPRGRASRGRCARRCPPCHRDGIVITRPFVVVMSKAGLFDRNQFPAPGSQVTAGQIKDFDAITASMPAYLWIITEGNRRPQQIDAGRAYVRVNLAGAAAADLPRT